MNAAYLWAQLEQAETIQQNRMNTWNAYNTFFSNELKSRDITLPVVPAECVHNAHMFYIKLPSLEMRTRFISYMKENGILCVFHYVPLHSSPAGIKFGQFSGTDVYTTADSERLVRLPLYYNLKSEDLSFILDKLRSFFNA